MTATSPSSPSSPSSSPDQPPHELPSLLPLSQHPLLRSPSFDPDSFLLTRLHIPLDELRAELRAHLSVLREELVQLINDDYEEFISLGTGLRGEGERLRGLKGPLKEVKEEVGSVRQVLREEEGRVGSKLTERAALREERALLELLSRLFETLTRAESLLDPQTAGPSIAIHPPALSSNGHGSDDRGKLVGRVASEYTQLIYLVGKAEAEECKIVDTIRPRIATIKDHLLQTLSDLLSSSLLDEPPSKSKLKHCLKIYAQIDSPGEAAEVVRRSFGTFCSTTIIASALTTPTAPLVPQTPHTPHTPRGDFNPLESAPSRAPLPEESPLAELYNRVLERVEGLVPLMDLAEEVSPYGFGIFERVVWPQICRAVVEDLAGVIFAAGRPSELHQHYTTTHLFLTHLESLAPSSRAVLAMRDSEEYASFERRWQLPVYFQLRWKEIVGVIEAALSGAKGAEAGEGGWCLKASEGVWKGLERCWDDEVFITELGGRFWRLSLQIVARYETWLKSQLDSFGNVEEDPAKDDAALRFAANVVADLDLIAGKVGLLSVPSELDVTKHLTLPIDPYADLLLQILTRRCSDTLKLVRSVASQLRAAPSSSAKQQAPTPSYFIPSILKPLRTLLSSRPTLAEKYGSTWSTQVVDAVLVSYAGILASVRKTEDLLRRHRKSKKGGFGGFFGGGGGSGAGDDEGKDEEERFRSQMRVDIHALKKDGEGLGVDVTELKGWKELEEVVERPAE